MVFDYKEISKEIGIERYNADIPSELIGIAHDFDRRVVKNNEKIFTGEFTVKGKTYKYPKNIRERLLSLRFATNAKIKLVENLKGIYTKKEVLSAINTYKP